jgi:hypothetical protein
MSAQGDAPSLDRRQAEKEPASAPAHGAPGVAEGEDDGLIRWMLGLTPRERLAVAQGFADSVMAMRSGRRA